MPAKRRQAKRALTIELPEEMAQRLDELLVQTRRSPSAEVALAVEFWLERQGIGRIRGRAGTETVPPCLAFVDREKS
jgi:predicted transcriptional regulator